MKNLNFSSPTHNVSLVGAEVGSGANQRKVLLIKQTNTLPDIEDMVSVSKALEQVTVSMSMQEFLRKWFDMWYDDAELLTKLLGFETEWEAYEKEQEGNESTYSHKSWLEERISQFSIMKSMNDGSLENISKSALIDTLALQEKFETALESYNKIQKENEMNEVEIAKAAQLKAETELASNVEVVKSLEAQVASLQEEISVFKQASVDAELSAIREEVKDVVAEDKLETIVKSLHSMDKEAAALVIETMKSAKQASKAAIDNSDLMEEVGQGEETDIKKAKEAAALDFLTQNASL